MIGLAKLSLQCHSSQKRKKMQFLVYKASAHLGTALLPLKKKLTNVEARQVNAPVTMGTW